MKLDAVGKLYEIPVYPDVDPPHVVYIFEKIIGEQQWDNKKVTYSFLEEALEELTKNNWLICSYSGYHGFFFLQHIKEEDGK